MESMAYFPIPGQEKTNSTRTVPPNKYPYKTAIMVDTGSKTFGKACRKIIEHFGMPIALADLINWESRTSFIKVLVTLSKGAPIVIAKVDAGRIIWATEAKNDSQLPVINESIMFPKLRSRHGLNGSCQF